MGSAFDSIVTRKGQRRSERRIKGLDGGECE
jgi:hypothetical protein